MSPELINILLQTVLPVAVTLFISIMHQRGVNMPLLSAILNALGGKPSPTPAPGPAVQIGDGHILKALLALLSQVPAPVPPTPAPVPTPAPQPDLASLLLQLLAALKAHPLTQTATS